MYITIGAIKIYIQLYYNKILLKISNNNKTKHLISVPCLKIVPKFQNGTQMLHIFGFFN